MMKVAWFSSPVSTVSTRDGWDHGRRFGEDTRKKKTLGYLDSHSAKASSTNNLSKYFHVDLRDWNYNYFGTCFYQRIPRHLPSARMVVPGCPLLKGGTNTKKSFSHKTYRILPFLRCLTTHNSRRLRNRTALSPQSHSHYWRPNFRCHCRWLKSLVSFLRRISTLTFKIQPYQFVITLSTW